MDAYVINEVVRFLEPEAIERDFVLVSPSGVKTIYPSTRSVRWTPSQLGAWEYEWVGGESGQFSVINQPLSLELIEETPAPQSAPGSALRSAPL